MKKVLSIALAVALCLSMAAMASAFDMGDHHPVITKGEIKISGDARVRGLARYNYDFNNEDSSDDIRLWDSRVRMVIDAKSVGGTLVTARLRMDGGYWGVADTQESIADGNEGNSYLVVADWFYMAVPMGPATLTIGRQTADWGNKFLVWDAKRDRAKLTAKFGSTTVGILTDKLTETLDSSDGNRNLRDKDDWAVLAIQQMGDWKVGTIWIYIEDNRRNASGNTAGLLHGTGGDSQKQYVIDVFFNGKAGGVAIDGEAAYKNNVGRLPDVGGYVQASFAAGPASVRVVAAHADGGYEADDDFIPLNMIGKDNPWAVMNFGGVPAGTSSTENRQSGATNVGIHGEGKSSTLVGAAAAVKLSDLYTVAVDGGYLFDDLANAWTASAAFVWQINADTNWTLLAGYWDGESKDDFWTNNTKVVGGSDNGIYREGDAYWVVGHKLEVKY